jgi:peptide deformylase
LCDGIIEHALSNNPATIAHTWARAGSCRLLGNDVRLGFIPRSSYTLNACHDLTVEHYQHLDAKPMAVLPILEFPDPRLRTRAKTVTQFDAALSRLIDDMLETMYVAPGIGLAATQVDVHLRLVVMDISETRDQPQVFINPEILARAGTEVMEEGCLSVPQIFEEVQRAASVKVKSQDRHGAWREQELDGLLAVCLQHEMDHLEGKLFVDYLSALKRDRIRRKLEKERRERSTTPSVRSAAPVI